MTGRPVVRPATPSQAFHIIGVEEVADVIGVERHKRLVNADAHFLSKSEQVRAGLAVGATHSTAAAMSLHFAYLVLV